MITDSKELLLECPAMLGEAHWVLVTETETVTPCVKKEQCPAQDFDIDSIFMYNVSDLDHIARTRKRLQKIKEVGMSYFNGEFFIEGIVSGFYVEKVWYDYDGEFAGYLDWVKSVIKEKTGK